MNLYKEHICGCRENSFRGYLCLSKVQFFLGEENATGKFDAPVWAEEWTRTRSIFAGAATPGVNFDRIRVTKRLRHLNASMVHSFEEDRVSVGEIYLDGITPTVYGPLHCTTCF